MGEGVTSKEVVKASIELFVDFRGKTQVCDNLLVYGTRVIPNFWRKQNKNSVQRVERGSNNTCAQFHAESPNLGVVLWTYNKFRIWSWLFYSLIPGITLDCSNIVIASDICATLFSGMLCEVPVASSLRRKNSKTKNQRLTYKRMPDW